MCDRVTIEIYIIDIIIVAFAVVVVCYLQRHNLISVCTMYILIWVYVRMKETARFIMPNGILFMFYVIFFLHCSIVAGGVCCLNEQKAYIIAFACVELAETLRCRSPNDEDDSLVCKNTLGLHNSHSYFLTLSLSLLHTLSHMTSISSRTSCHLFCCCCRVCLLFLRTTTWWWYCIRRIHHISPLVKLEHTDIEIDGQKNM